MATKPSKPDQGGGNPPAPAPAPSQAPAPAPGGGKPDKPSEAGKKADPKRPGKADDMRNKIPAGKKPTKQAVQAAMDALDMTKGEGAQRALARRKLKLG